jgi:hypothetical protein
MYIMHLQGALPPLPFPTIFLVYISMIYAVLVEVITWPVSSSSFSSPKNRGEDIIGGRRG